MSLEINFTPEAEDTYNSISVQLQSRWGEKFVTTLEEKISKVLNIISEDPYAYPPAGNDKEIRRCVLHKNCSMIYKVKNDYIHVICFWDNRQEPMSF